MNAAVIVAAGRGTRMGPEVDKLFLEAAGRPIIAHTWQRFQDADCIHEIVLVVRAGLEKAFPEMATRFGFQKPWRVVTGGVERQDSVWNGLQAVSDQTQVVAIQDGARPCTTAALIRATIGAAQATGAAVAAQRVTDTIKESDDGVVIVRHPERSRFWAVQTPQAFRIDVIRRALAAVRERGARVTDDTAACDLIGQRVQLVESRSPNPKITVPDDLALLEWRLSRMNDPSRTAADRGGSHASREIATI